MSVHQEDTMAKANPSTLQRILHNSQTSHRTRGNHHRHYLYNVRFKLYPQKPSNHRGRDKLTLVLFLDKIPHVTRRDFAKEFNIIIRMELCHFALRRRFSALSINKTLKTKTPGEGCQQERAGRCIIHLQISPSSCRAHSSLPRNGTCGSEWVSC